MEKELDFLKKAISVLILLAIVGYVFVLPFSVPKAEAQFVTKSFSSTILDIPRIIEKVGVTIAKAFLQQLKKRFLTMIQNDLVNWVQGGGKPRFVTDPAKFFKNAADTAAVQAVDSFFSQKGLDICSPFKANLQLLVERSVFLPEQRARCTLGDIKKVHLDSFKENFQNGGWRTWIALHETSNTLPGTYLAAVETIGGNVSRAGNTATAQLSAGKGFLDQKNCLVYQVRVSSEEALEGVDYSALTPAQQEQFAKSGNVSETVDVRQPPYNKRDGISMNEVPGNATCIESKTVTPGSVIGDQISGALKSTGIDKIVNAREIAEILDAVIDAAVNRAAREGLALMKSGRGSYTKPQAGTYKDRARVQADTQGLEGVQAAEFLNTAVSLKNNVDSLEGLLNKFTANQNREESFRNWLKAMPGTAGSFTCSEKKAPNTAAKIERCFYNWDRYGNFNEENNNPGPYLANKLMLEETGKLWLEIKKIFEAKSNASCFNNFTLHPDEDDLPIIGGDGDGFVWEKAEPYYKALEGLKKKQILGEFAAAGIEAQSIVQASASAAETYGTLKQQNEQIKTQISADKAFINNVLPTLTLYTTVLMDYDTAGREITVNGTATNLVTVVKEYTRALDGRDEAAVEAAKVKLNLARRATENKWRQNQAEKIPTATDERDLAQAEDKLRIIDRAIQLTARSTLSALTARLVLFEDNKRITRSAPISEISSGQIIEVRPGETIPADGTIDRVLDQNGKITSIDAYRPGQEVVAREVNRSNLTLEIKVTNIINEADQTGLTPSEAVAKAMLELKDRDTKKPLAPVSIDQIVNELDLRESKVSKQKIDAANKLGKFLTSTEERIRAGVDGGDSEWEKYFYNRSQYAYSSIIYDYYKNRFNCGQ